MIININKTTKKEVNCLDINGNGEADLAILRILEFLNMNSFQQLHKK